MAHARTFWSPAFHGLSHLRRLALCCVVFYSSLGLCQAVPDYQIKAAMLYHFTQFIEWPPEKPDGVFVICVAGDTAVRTSLEELIRGKFVGSRSIQVKQIKEAREIHACHEVFLSSSLSAKTPLYLAGAHELDVLTVGEQPGFRDQGGMIELFLDDNRIHFDINEQALRDGHLRASSHLLRLARRAEPIRSGGAP